MIVLTYMNFKKEVLDSELPFLVFFTREDESCRIMAERLAEAERIFKGKLEAGKVNVNTFSKLGPQHSISGYPAIEMFFGGEAKDELVGNIPLPVLMARIERFMENSYASLVKRF